MRKRGGSYLFLPASKALLLGILVYSSKAGAHASGVSRARWQPLHAHASRLGDRHLIWGTDISSGGPTSRLGDRHLVPHITQVRRREHLWERAPSRALVDRAPSRALMGKGRRSEHFRWIQTSRECAG